MYAAFEQELEGVREPSNAQTAGAALTEAVTVGMAGKAGVEEVAEVEGVRRVEG